MLDSKFEKMTKQEIVNYIREHPEEILDLSGANLSEANLSRANLSRANLSGADLSGAMISNYRFHASGLKDKTVKHLMALDFQWLGKNAEKIVKECIKQDVCPFETFKPPFYVLAGNYWDKIKGFFTTDLSFAEIWQMVVNDLNETRKEA